MQMEKLCLHYGSLIGEIDSRQYYDMPPASALTAPGVEAHLRQLGFGYRAKYLHQTALMISEDHEDGWLDTLRNPESPIMGMKPLTLARCGLGEEKATAEPTESCSLCKALDPKLQTAYASWVSAGEKLFLLIHMVCLLGFVSSTILVFHR